MAKNPSEQYSEQETQQRFEAMLRASRMVGHKPMKKSAKPAKRKRTLRPRAKR